MSYKWFNVTNFDEFVASGLPSKSIEVDFTGIGLKTILLTAGNYFGVVVDGIFLVIGLNAAQPFAFDDRAVFLDVNNDLWIGIAE